VPQPRHQLFKFTSGHGKYNPVFSSPRPLVKDKLAQQLRLKTSLRYNLELHDYGTLPRYDVKAKRFKDLKPKE